jgi:DNA-binding NtrC family response regulator
VDERLRRYGWPGNVRELEHLIQRAVLVCSDGVIRLDDLPLIEETATGQPADLSSLDDLDSQLAAREREFLQAAMESVNWVIYGDRGAARQLGVHPEKLRRRLRRVGLHRPDPEE